MVIAVVEELKTSDPNSWPVYSTDYGLVSEKDILEARKPGKEVAK